MQDEAALVKRRRGVLRATGPSCWLASWLAAYLSSTRLGPEMLSCRRNGRQGIGNFCGEGRSMAGRDKIWTGAKTDLAAGAVYSANAKSSSPQ